MPEERGEERKARIVVFDLDRTLTKRGSHTPFILFCLTRRPWRAYWAPLVLLAGAGYALKLVGREGMKSLMLRAVLAGTREEGARGLGLGFARRWIAREFRDEMRDRLVRHQAEGERVILATAAFDIYAEPIAEALGIGEVIATHVELDRDRRVTGRIAGGNCFGPAKLRRVQEALPSDPESWYLTVYSDDPSDLALLQAAHRGVAVHPKSAFRQQAEAAGLEIIEDQS
jgi:HAD superfamily hydrolase (TIGR01490 family)